MRESKIFFKNHSIESMLHEFFIIIQGYIFFFSDKNVLIKVGQMKGLVQADMEYVVYVSTKYNLSFTFS